jgi:hypothetical protein
MLKQDPINWDEVTAFINLHDREDTAADIADHMAASARARGKGPRKPYDMSDTTCYMCQGKGHMAKDCPHKDKIREAAKTVIAGSSTGSASSTPAPSSTSPS